MNDVYQHETGLKNAAGLGSSQFLRPIGQPGRFHYAIAHGKILPVRAMKRGT
jgi:hypothetical protein